MRSPINDSTVQRFNGYDMIKPLVSILVAAYNAEHCFAMTEGYHIHLGDS
jgi:hypothetical protein